MIHQTLVTPLSSAALSRYHTSLSGCRFCPMCKVAGEVANLTLMESHSTRARAMMLWRARHDLRSLTARQVELLYQSTLDSISEAWCISHAPVSNYIAEARAAIFEIGLAPGTVLAALERPTPTPPPVKSSVLLLASEAAELGDVRGADSAVELLWKNSNYGDAEVLVATSGALAYSLGARDLARQQAEVVVERIMYAGANRVIADGPQTFWALQRIYPTLGVIWPENVTIISLSQALAEQIPNQTHAHLSNGNGAGHGAKTAKSALFLDSRSASLVADTLATGEAIQPGFHGPESALGTGEAFEAPRRLLDSLGIRRAFQVWSRSLAKSSGADDGLWLTYPALADRLARQRLEEAKHRKVDLLVTDSLLSARHLALNADTNDVHVRWLPELIAESL